MKYPNNKPFSVGSGRRLKEGDEFTGSASYELDGALIDYRGPFRVLCIAESPHLRIRDGFAVNSLNHCLAFFAL